MTGIRRTALSLGVFVLAVPLTGAGLVLAAAPAYAGGAITSPGNGVEFTTDTTVRIRADISGTTKVTLSLTSPLPGSSAQPVASGQGSVTNNTPPPLAYDLDTSCATYPSPTCSGRAPALNGVWTVTLSGGANDSSTFVLRIPPKAPRSLTARADGYRAVVLSWPRGEEPDLTGWTVYGDGAVVQDNVGTGACSSTACSTTVTYSQDGTGAHTYSLVAHRRTAPGSTATLDSPQSPQASATLDAPPPPPPPSPTASPASSSPSGGGAPAGGGTSPSAGGSSPAPSGSPSSASPAAASGSAGGAKGSSAIGTSDGSTPSAVAQRQAFALTFKAFAPKLGIPKLPPLPAAPAVAPLPDGSYQTTLGYKEVVKREKVAVPQASVQRITGAVGNALDSGQFLRSLAGAMILLLAAAHLRRWLGGHETE